MSFSRTAIGLKSKLHMSHIPNAAIAGGLVLVLLALGGVAATYASCSHAASAQMEVISGEHEVLREASAPSEGDVASGGEAPDENASEDAPDSEPKSAFVAVHVSGAVVSPGVYRVEEGSRVEDVVLAAGGFASDAACGSINLARKVSDGEQVVVLTQEEAPSPAAAPSGDSSAGSPASSAGPVNINTADVAALDALPGVGPATAQAIVDERAANGPFASIEDIQRVSGIGGKKFEKLKDDICV